MKTTLNIILGLILAVAVFCSWLAPIDTPATQQVDASLKRAAASYASARLINAMISAAQGTEISLAPAGLGMIFTPGQALEPFNCMVEDFANLMLAACVAFGVQKVLINIGAYWLISLLLTLVAIGWLLLYFQNQKPPSWLSKALVILLMIRFAVPVVNIGTDLAFQKFLASDYEINQKAIDTVPFQIAHISQEVQISPEKQGLIDQMKNWNVPSLDVKKHFDEFRQASEQWIENFIKLIVIFLLQTLIIPLLLLWLLYALAKNIFALPKYSTH